MPLPKRTPDRLFPFTVSEKFREFCMFAAPPAEGGGKRMNDSSVHVHNNTMCVKLSGDAAETKKRLVLKMRVEKNDTHTHTHQGRSDLSWKSSCDVFQDWST